MTTPFTLCIDVGGSSLKRGVLKGQATPASDVTSHPIDSNADQETILKTFADAIRPPLEAEGWQLAFSFPGPCDYPAGICLIEGLAKYAAIYRLNIGDALRERLNMPNLPIRFRNDAEAAVLGEVRYGVGRAYRRVIGVTLGTGFGSAFVSDGEVQRIGDDIPPNGELNLSMTENDRADDIFSTRGLIAALEAAGFAEVNPFVASQKARLGDATAQRVFNTFGSRMGRFLQTYVESFRADGVIVMGGIANAFDLFSEPLRSELSVPVRLGELGAWAALYGAGDLFYRDAV